MRLNNMNNKKWFVLYTKPKHELKVKENLSSVGIESSCPTIVSDRIWSDRTKKVREVIIKLVRKHTGIENIISNILASIDNIKAIYLVGDYAKGVDSGTIKIYIKAKIKDKSYISEVLKKTEKKISRKIILVDKIDPFEEKLLIHEIK